MTHSSRSRHSVGGESFLFTPGRLLGLMSPSGAINSSYAEVLSLHPHATTNAEILIVKWLIKEVADSCERLSDPKIASTLFL